MAKMMEMGHVVLPGTPEHGTPEHRNITEHSGTPPKNPEHSQENQEHLKKTLNTPKKTRNTPKKNPKSQKADVPPLCYRARELL